MTQPGAPKVGSNVAATWISSQPTIAYAVPTLTTFRRASAAGTPMRWTTRRVWRRRRATRDAWQSTADFVMARDELPNRSLPGVRRLTWSARQLALRRRAHRPAHPRRVGGRARRRGPHRHRRAVLARELYRCRQDAPGRMSLPRGLPTAGKAARATAGAGRRAPRSARTTAGRP